VFAAPLVAVVSARAQCRLRGAKARPASAAAAPRRVLGQVTQAHPGQRREVRGGVLELDLSTRPHGYDGVAIGAYREVRL